MYLERDSLLQHTEWSYSEALPWIGADSADPPNPYNPTLTAQLCEHQSLPIRLGETFGGVFSLVHPLTGFQHGCRQITWTRRLTNRCVSMIRGYI